MQTCAMVPRAAVADAGVVGGARGRGEGRCSPVRRSSTMPVQEPQLVMY